MPDFSFLFERNIIQTISILGGIQGLILSVLVLFYPKMHRSSNVILSLFIFSLTLIILSARIKEFVPYEHMWPIYGVRFASLMLLYFYIKSLYRQINWKSEWWNFLLLGIHLLISFFEVRIEYTPYVLDNAFERFSMVIQLFTIALYYVLLFKTLKEYKVKVIENFSTMHKLGYHWSRQLILFFLAITLYQFFVMIYYMVWQDFQIGPLLSLFNTLNFAAYMYFIAIKGKLNPAIYRLRKLSFRQAESKELSQTTVKEIENEALQQIAQKVTHQMEVNKAFLNSTLTLNEFAESINEKAYLVSQAINQCLGKSFFDLVNFYRVKEAKKLLLDEDLSHLSVLGIGFESGFNSKTTFNTTFKKLTGVTPTAYKNQHS